MYCSHKKLQLDMETMRFTKKLLKYTYKCFVVQVLQSCASCK